VEFVLLRSAMHRRIGVVPSSMTRIAKLWLIALASGLVAYLIKRLLPFGGPLLVGPAVLIPFAAVYLGISQLMGVASAGAITRVFKRRV
jgi:hypothetical protein